MSFIVYNTKDNHAIGVYDTEQAAQNNVSVSDTTYIVVEYEWKETDYLVSMKLDADGVLSNKFPGKTIEEQKSLIEIEDAAKRLVEQVAFKTEKIKMDSADYINELKWKLTRARDNDLVNGNSDSMAEVLAEIDSIRSKSNAAEVALNALTTEEEVIAFDVKEQFN
ncbi:MAG: hypothetical protein CMO44_07350 [Verrucomicrobiales bacterium]|nr:hypothetical protein [Verrucomicrobiales bacterium]